MSHVIETGISVTTSRKLSDPLKIAAKRKYCIKSFKVFSSARVIVDRRRKSEAD